MQKPLPLWLNHTLFDDHNVYSETLKINQLPPIMLKESFWNCNCIRLRIKNRNLQATEFKFEIPSLLTFAINTTLPPRSQCQYNIHVGEIDL